MVNLVQPPRENREKVTDSKFDHPTQNRPPEVTRSRYCSKILHSEISFNSNKSNINKDNYKQFVLAVDEGYLKLLGVNV